MNLRNPLTAILLFLVATRLAAAQGTSGVFPDPIADRDLSVYAERLAMSPQQRLEVDRFHESYLREVLALREGPIQEFLDASGNLMRTLMIAPDVKAMKTALRELDRINDRIRANDEQLFDRMLSVLSEDQAAGLEQVRRQRERERSLGGAVRYITYAHPVLRADLGDIVEDIDLAPDERTAIAPLLTDYESRATAATRRLAKETTDMFESIVRRIEDLGLEDARDARGRARTAWRELRTIWLESSDGVMDAVTALADVNRRSARTLAASLPPEAGRRLTDAFRERAYRDIFAGSRTVVQKYEIALRLPDLQPEQVKTIEATRDALVQRHDRLAEEMIDVVDKTQRQTMLRRFGGTRAPDNDRMESLERERDALNEQALATLEAILGADGMVAIARRARAPEDADEVGVDDKTAAAGKGDATAGRSERPGRALPRTAPPVRSRAVPRRADPFLPDAITDAEVSAAHARLGLSDDQAEVLQSLYREYVTTFDQLTTDRIEPLVERATNLWTMEEQTGRLLPPGPAAIDALFTERRGVFAAIRAADTTFLDDVAVVVVGRVDARQDEAMNAVRRARERVAWNVGVDPRTGMPFGSRPTGGGAVPHESSLDLGVLFDETKPTTEARTRAASILGPYERSLLALFRERYEFAFAYAREHESIRAEATHARNAPREERLNVAASYRRLTDGKGAELRRVSGEIVTLNRTTLESLVAALPAKEGSELRNAYRRVANPDVFDDDGAVGPHFRRALALDDLDPEQRARIGELFAEYRAAYASLNDALVDLDRASADPDAARADWRERQRRRNAREQIEFQRKELNEKALRRLRAALGENRAIRLGIDGD